MQTRSLNATLIALAVSRRALFAANNCISCHGKADWASSKLNLLGAMPVLKDALRDLGTFIATAPNELKQNGTIAAGAFGLDPPSLPGVAGLAPYLDNGSAQTLEDLMSLKQHRTAGLAAGAAYPFDNPANLADIVKFLEVIDTGTQPFPIP